MTAASGAAVATLAAWAAAVGARAGTALVGGVTALQEVSATTSVGPPRSSCETCFSDWSLLFGFLFYAIAL